MHCFWRDQSPSYAWGCQILKLNQGHMQEPIKTEAERHLIRRHMKQYLTMEPAFSILVSSRGDGTSLGWICFFLPTCTCLFSSFLILQPHVCSYNNQLKFSSTCLHLAVSMMSFSMELRVTPGNWLHSTWPRICLLISSGLFQVDQKADWRLLLLTARDWVQIESNQVVTPFL